MNYSGQLLSDIPYAEIFEGMEVVSASKGTGSVIDKIDKEDDPNQENDNWIIINWEYGAMSHKLHMHFNDVVVK